MTEFKKLNVKWTPDIQQDLDAICNPKSPFYEPDTVERMERLLNEDYTKHSDETSILLTQYHTWKKSLA